jgi:site-specific DNA-cytosine methylase
MAGLGGMEAALEDVMRDWRALLPRDMLVAEVFAGMGGFRRLLAVGKTQCVCKNVFELDSRYEAYYAKLADEIGDAAKAEFEDHKYGAEGDMLNVDPETLCPVDGLVAGPPCQPWSSAGKRLGARDPRSAPFKRLLEWIVLLANAKGLLFFAVENSPNIQAALHGEEEPFLVFCLRKLRHGIPFFAIDWRLSQLRNYAPQNRCRLWIRGIRKDILPDSATIPSPLVRIGPLQVPPLESFLDAAVGNVSMQQVSDAWRPLRQQRLVEVKSRIREDVAANRAGVVAVSDLDAPRLTVHYDEVPTLTCRGPRLFLLSVQGLGLAESEMKFHRFLTNEERCALMGHPPRRVSGFSQNMAWKATGNAFAVQMCAAIVCPMIDVVLRSGVIRAEGVVPTSSAIKRELTVSGAYAALCNRKRMLEIVEGGATRARRRHTL